MKGFKKNVPRLAGIRLAVDTTDEPAGALCSAVGAILRPTGCAQVSSGSSPLHGMTSLEDYEDQLGISEDDNTCLILMGCGGRLWVAAWDAYNKVSVGWEYAGIDPDWTTLPPKQEWNRRDIELKVLRRGLSRGLVWRGYRAFDTLILGNGRDPNFVLEVRPSIVFRPMGYQIRPLEPTVSASPMAETPNIQASLSVGGLTFEAAPNLPGWRGNNVAVKITRDAAGTSIVSQLSGRGTWSDPLLYEITLPMNPVPSVDSLIAWINRDGNAAGVVEASGGGTGAVEESVATRLFGGTDAVSGAGFPQGIIADPVSGEDTGGDRVTVVLTYVYRAGPYERVETSPSLPSEVVPVNDSVLAVNIEEDPDATDFDSIRVYVSDPARDDVSAHTRPYRLYAEVPIGTAVVYIHPSMRTGIELPSETRVPPPCRFFRYHAGHLFMSGNRDYPYRVWATRAASEKNPLPETAHGTNYCDLFDPTGADGRGEIVAIGEFRGRLLAWFGGAISTIPISARQGATPPSSKEPGRPITDISLGGNWLPIDLCENGKHVTREFLTR